MSWFRCDDQLGDHPKVMALDEKLLPAMGLWVLCGVYCSKHLTDGFVPRKVVRMYGGEKLAKDLERAGLFNAAPGGWTMHDYLHWNPSKEQVLANRSKRQAAGQAGGRASGQARAQANGEANASAAEEAPAQAKPNPVPVPVPRPQPVTEILSSVLGNATADEGWIDPDRLYMQLTRRRSLSTKERNWLEDLYLRFSRAELVAALRAVPNPRETNFLQRVDDYMERRAA
jgi:hypothetical protein